MDKRVLNFKKRNERIYQASCPRPELRERIIDTAVEAFSARYQSITMDDIATSLGISKRTLYEVFSDKETLLEECILKGQKEGDEF